MTEVRDQRSEPSPALTVLRLRGLLHEFIEVHDSEECPDCGSRHPHHSDSCLIGRTIQALAETEGR